MAHRPLSDSLVPESRQRAHPVVDHDRGDGAERDPGEGEVAEGEGEVADADQADEAVERDGDPAEHTGGDGVEQRAER